MSEQEKITKVVQTYDQPIEVGLSRNAKGQYYWKINVRAESPLVALRQVQDIDAELRHRFSEVPGPNPSSEAAVSVSAQDPHYRMEKAIEGVKKAAEKGPFRSE